MSNIFPITARLQSLGSLISALLRASEAQVGMMSRDLENDGLENIVRTVTIYVVQLCNKNTSATMHVKVVA